MMVMAIDSSEWHAFYYRAGVVSYVTIYLKRYKLGLHIHTVNTYYVLTVNNLSSIEQAVHLLKSLKEKLAKVYMVAIL